MARQQRATQFVLLRGKKVHAEPRRNAEFFTSHHCWVVMEM
jgi:hypothetical protein